MQALAPALELVPAVHATQAPGPPAEAVPAPHVSQTRSDVAVPDDTAPLPALQAVHFAQEALLSATLKLPAAQAVHWRSAVVVPALLTNWPAAQMRFGTQGVAALPSSSQVLAMHAVLGLLLPGQWLPASQAAQTGGALAVPALVSTVPAWHAPSGRHSLWFF